MSWIENNEWLDAHPHHGVRWPAVRRFLAHYRPFRRSLIGAGLLALTGSFTAFLIPAVFRTLQEALAAHDARLLALALGTFLAITLADIGAAYGIQRIRARVATQLSRRLVTVYYEKVLNLRIEDFLGFKHRSNLFQRVIDAMMITGEFTDLLIRGGRSLIVLMVVGTVVGRLAPAVLAVLLAGMIALFAFVLAGGRGLRELRQRTLAVSYPLVNRMIEVIEGLFTIKALTASVQVSRDVADLIAQKAGCEQAESVAGSRLTAAARAIRAITLVAAWGTGFALLMGQRLALADIFALYVLTSLLVEPIEELALLYQSLSRLSANVGNYYQILDLPDENGPCEPLHAPLATPARRRLELVETGTALLSPTPVPSAPPGQIVFENVWFTYGGGPPILTGLDLEIRTGERISLIGRSGAGKTTLLRLLLGFVRPQRGGIYVDGHDLAVLPDKTAYRRQFGVVTQQDILFNVSLRENLTFGLSRTVTEAELERALQATNLWGDVHRLPEGLSTVYRTDMLSVGQKQRFFIARALLRDPSIVLLDEPTSALDFQNEGLVLRAIAELMGGKTTVTVTHRLSTLRDADRVMVLDDGKISASGSHEWLYQTNHYYRDLCEYNSFVI